MTWQGMKKQSRCDHSPMYNWSSSGSSSTSTSFTTFGWSNFFMMAISRYTLKLHSHGGEFYNKLSRILNLTGIRAHISSSNKKNFWGGTLKNMCPPFLSSTTREGPFKVVIYYYWANTPCPDSFSENSSSHNNSPEKISSSYNLAETTVLCNHRTGTVCTTALQLKVPLQQLYRHVNYFI